MSPAISLPGNPLRIARDPHRVQPPANPLGNHFIRVPPAKSLPLFSYESVGEFASSCR